jgi:hypothetical protein
VKESGREHKVDKLDLRVPPESVLPVRRQELHRRGSLGESAGSTSWSGRLRVQVEEEVAWAAVSRRRWNRGGVDGAGSNPSTLGFESVESRGHRGFLLEPNKIAFVGRFDEPLG